MQYKLLRKYFNSFQKKKKIF